MHTLSVYLCFWNIYQKLDQVARLNPFLLAQKTSLNLRFRVLISLHHLTFNFFLWNLSGYVLYLIQLFFIYSCSTVFMSYVSNMSELHGREQNDM